MNASDLEVAEVDPAMMRLTLPAGVDIVAGPFEVSGVGEELTGEAQLHFELDDSWDWENDVPIVVWEDAAGSFRWLPSEVSGDRRVLSATTDHFSIGFLGKVDVAGFAKDWGGQALDYLSGRAGAVPPSCGDEEGVRSEGVQVSSDGGDGVMWCLGTLEGVDVLKVTNNRRSVAQVTYPEGWNILDGEWGALSLEGVNRLAVGAIDNLTAAPGTDVRLVTGGDTLTFELPSEPNGSVTVSMSVLSWAFSGLLFAWDVVRAIAGAANSKLANLNVADRLFHAEAWNALGEGWFGATKKCLESVSDLTESPVDPISGSTARQLLLSMWGCVAGLLEADIEEAGIRFFGSGVVLAVVGTVIGLVLSAVHLIVSGLRELWDSFASFGGESDVFYDIVVTFEPNPPVLGDCEGLHTEPALEGGLQINSSVCAWPWALVSASDANSKVAVTVLLMEGFPAVSVGRFFSVEQGPSVSGYTVAAIAATSGMPADTAQLLYDALGGPTAGASAPPSASDFPPCDASSEGDLFPDPKDPAGTPYYCEAGEWVSPF